MKHMAQGHLLDNVESIIRRARHHDDGLAAEVEPGSHGAIATSARGGAWPSPDHIANGPTSGPSQADDDPRQAARVATPLRPRPVLLVSRLLPRISEGAFCKRTAIDDAAVAVIRPVSGAAVQVV